MNKIALDRHSLQKLPRRDQEAPSLAGIRHSQAATLILHKETELLNLRKRISALSVRQDSNINKTYNNELKHRKQSVARD